MYAARRTCSGTASWFDLVISLPPKKRVLRGQDGQPAAFAELGGGLRLYASAGLLGQVMNMPISPGLPPG
jgi:hypothetical protein